jgi:hypothetical protein
MTQSRYFLAPAIAFAAIATSDGTAAQTESARALAGQQRSEMVVQQRQYDQATSLRMGNPYQVQRQRPRKSTARSTKPVQRLDQPTVKQPVPE